MLRFHFGLLTACALLGGASVAAAQPPARCPSTQTSTFTGNDPTTGRLTLDGTPSKCGANKAFPGANEASTVRYQTFAYENRTAGDACVSVSVTATSGEVQTAAYLGGFSATNLALDYVGDPGGSASALAGSTKATQSYSFNVPALRPFVVMVEETVHGAGGSYSVSVTDCGQVVATRVRPVFGPTAGGQSVAIDGEGFLAGAGATLGGAPLTNVAVANDVALTGLAPPHAAGVVDVVVTNKDGSTTTLKSAYTYIAHAPTSIALEASPTSSVAGQPVTLTAHVAGKNDPGTLDGTVTFRDGATVLGKAAVAASGAASIATPLHAGAHAITATYDGGTYFDGSKSAALAPVVAKAASQVVLLPSMDPASPGADVAFTATLTAMAPGGGTPSGPVTFSEGPTALGTAPVDATGHAAWVAKGLTVGTHAIVATYAGDGDFLAGHADYTETIGAGGTQVALSSPGTSLYGWPVTMTATLGGANPGVAPTGTVVFTIDGSALPAVDVTAGKATMTTSDLTAGSHDVTATYSGDAQNLGASASMTQDVQRADVTVAVTATPSADGAFVTVTVSAQRGASPTGRVHLLDAGMGAANLDLADGVASTTLPSGPGYYDLTATYDGDTNHFSGSGTASLIVGDPDAGAPPPPYDAGTWVPPTYDAGDYETWTSDQVDPPPTEACTCSAVGGTAPGSLGALAVFGAAAATVMVRRRRTRRSRLTGRT